MKQLAGFCLALALMMGVASAADAPLRGVVIVSRHGVRSALSQASLAKYAARPWAPWEVPPGILTPHGYRLMVLFGSYYRALYAQAGILPAAGCPTAGSVYLYADVDERTKASAQAIGEGVAPGCHIAVDASSASSDPLFAPLPTFGKADPGLSRAALLGMYGGNPMALYAAYAQPLAELETILGCAHGECAQLRDTPIVIKTSSTSGLAYASGGLSSAGSAVDALMLQYADGKPDAGWGRLNAQTLLEIDPLLRELFTINRGSPYASRAEGSNMLLHLQATIDQIATGKRDPQTRAPLGATFVGILGHDTTLFEIATNLQLSWMAQGYQRDALPPGGALVFEVRAPAGGEPFVRTFFTAQSLDQMRDATPLTLDAPPLRVPVFMPGCPSYDCPISIFDTVVGSKIDRSFVGAW